MGYKAVYLLINYTHIILHSEEQDSLFGWFWC